LYKFFILSFYQEEKTQILTTNVRIEQKWFDENLSWNQSDYDGIRGIRLPSHRIWLPDSYIYNAAFDLSAHAPTQAVVNGPYVMIYSTGEVVFPVLMKLRTTCKVNIQYFPFDRQICGLKFASWIYDVSSINYELVANSNDQQQSENIRNSGWAILDVKQGLVWRYVSIFYLIRTMQKKTVLVNDFS
jgi:nicotinic acetylcholine receptor